MAAEVIAGRFELIEHIAEGGSGSVWLAYDRQHARRCAAKVMRQSYSGEVLRFVREQGVKFEHRHLLTPYGWAAVDDQVVLASELMRGGNLHTAMQDYGAFSPELVAEILVQLLDGLAHVHAAGWVHRDVKPANVLLELTGPRVPQVRLTDFGIAAHEDAPRLTQLGITVGTEGFLAPEQLAGQDPAPAQDLYALAVLGVQLLEPTLHGDQLRRRCDQLRTEPSKVPAPLGKVLAGLLAQDPRQREKTAHTAAGSLSPMRSQHGYQVASGEAFEVFDHFADLAEQAADTPELSSHQEVQSAATPQAGEKPIPAPGTPQNVVPVRPRPWQPLLLLLVALLLGALSLWLVFGDSSQTQSTAEQQQYPAPTASGQIKPESRPTGSKTPQPAEPETTLSAQPTPSDRVSENTLTLDISSNVREGDECTVLEVGLSVHGATGDTLSCLIEGATQRWLAAD